MSEEETPNPDQSEKTELEKVKDLDKQLRQFKVVVQTILTSLGFIWLFGKLQQWFPSLQSTSIKRIEERINKIFSFIFKTIGGLIAILIIAGSIRGILSQNYIFQDFTVPEKYEKIGVSGEVLKNKIIHRANTLVQNQDLPFSAKDNSIPEEDFEIMGISVNAIFGMIRSTLKRNPTFITANLISLDTELSLELNINQKNSKNGRETEVISIPNCEDRPKACLDEIIESAAYWLLSFEDPFSSAYYYFQEQKMKKARQILRKATVEQDSTNTDNWRSLSKMYNLWGETLYSSPEDPVKHYRTNNHLALAKFKKATEYSDYSIPQAWANLGDVNMVLNRSIFEKWFQNYPDTLAKDYQSLLDSIHAYYLVGDTLSLALQEDQDTSLCRFEPKFRAKAEFYRQVRDGKIKPETSIDSSDIQQLIEDPKELLGLAQSFKQSKRNDLVLKAYLQYLDYVRENENDDALEPLLYDLVGLDHPFLEILRNTKQILEDTTIDSLRKSSHQLIEKLVYFDWEYDIFDFEFIDEEVLEQETNFPDPRQKGDTTTWSALTLIPDPQLSNGPLDVSTEQLWYYLYWKYGNNLYTKRTRPF
ncbi:MAG: hypothetical protein F6K19_23990 [Cyanothece sp. SIO1E1]|nr:hypothetical protein [Cyanothece sp. SIO1E1]